MTGVAAAELLERIAAVRAGHAPAAAAAVEVRAWRLVDFGDGTDDEFVDRVHLVLLGRPVTGVERARRRADLARGSSRFEVVMRLALCPEGRRPVSKPVKGLALPVLVRAGRVLELAAGQPALSPVVAQARPLAASVLGGSPRARLARRGARLGVASAVVALAGRSLGQRRELTALREDLRRLQR